MVRSCKDCQRQLGQYLEGDLKGVALQRITIHLEECSACREYLDRLEKLRTLLSRYSHPPLKADYWFDFWPRLRIRIRAATRTTSIFSLPRILTRPITVPYAAAAGAVAAALILFVSLRDDGAEKADIAAVRFGETNLPPEGGDYVLASPSGGGRHPVGDLRSSPSDEKNDDYVLARADTSEPSGREEVKYVLAGGSMTGGGARYW